MHTAAALSHHRILFLGGHLDSDRVNAVVAGLVLLDADNHEDPIDLYVNSPSGGVADGMAVIDAIQAIRAPVHTVCIGQAAGVATLVVAAGTPGKRAATRHAVFAPHMLFGQSSTQIAGVEVAVGHVLEQEAWSWLAKCTGQTVERICLDVRNEHVFTADDARAYGIVDRVVQPFEVERPRSFIRSKAAQ